MATLSAKEQSLVNAIINSLTADLNSIVDFDNVAALTGYKDAKAAKEMWRVLKKNKLTTNSGQENGDEAAEAFGVTKTTTPKKGKGKAVKQNGSEDSEAVETPKTGKGRSKKTATSTPRKRKSGEVDDDAEVEATPTKRARARTPKKAKAATKKNAKEEEEDLDAGEENAGNDESGAENAGGQLGSADEDVKDAVKEEESEYEV